MSKRDSHTANLPGRYEMAEDMEIQDSYVGSSATPTSILTLGPQHYTNFPPALSNPLASASPSTPQEPCALPHLGTTFRPLHPLEFRT